MHLKHFHPEMFTDKQPRLVDNFCFITYCKNGNTYTRAISTLVATGGYNAKENMSEDEEEP